jgi:hypothetical protein
MLSLLLAATLALSAAGDDDLLWVEGEAAKTKDVGPLHGWYNSIKKDLLSGGDWVSNYSGKDGLVTYEVESRRPPSHPLRR